uniref:HYR domain-containing protein n=1 Tax=Chromera velia CCMP2878 TaxID=1169474 RepID=A0A0G4F9K8_9ALVE|eukprot:Cvel_15749.t1-p1 / transcript=Cvel_15749.t1 / gene=Cvel_15749 / organism=Chromera_velia_CCMP2878 / gene_product=hypothetical protein / transcript_product=hypothetical protein / location=Cvel_scaffold1179:19650-27917(+) / protein_length=660 / sequence_SO=supercontig / SO=protein_coding / is_pseudo=false
MGVLCDAFLPDFNECANFVHDCATTHSCVNTQGSFECDQKPSIKCPSEPVKVPTEDAQRYWIMTADAVGRCEASDAKTSQANIGIEYSPQIGSLMQFGSESVSVTATDSVGGSASCFLLVSVEDREAPRVVCPSALSVKSVRQQLPRVFYPQPAVVGDNVDASETLQITYEPPNGSLDSAVLFAVQASSSDSSGNVGECSFLVSVELCPSNSERVNADGDCGCKNGFYRDLDASESSVICRGCPNNANSTRGSVHPSACSCAEGFYFVPAPGRFADSSAYWTGGECRACPKDADCAGGFFVSSETLPASEGTRRSLQEVNSFGNTAERMPTHKVLLKIYLGFTSQLALLGAFPIYRLVTRYTTPDIDIDPNVLASLMPSVNVPQPSALFSVECFADSLNPSASEETRQVEQDPVYFTDLLVRSLFPMLVYILILVSFLLAVLCHALCERCCKRRSLRRAPPISPTDESGSPRRRYSIADPEANFELEALSNRREGREPQGGATGVSKLRASPFFGFSFPSTPRRPAQAKSPGGASSTSPALYGKLETKENKSASISDGLKTANAEGENIEAPQGSQAGDPQGNRETAKKEKEKGIQWSDLSQTLRKWEEVRLRTNERLFFLVRYQFDRGTSIWRKLAGAVEDSVQVGHLIEKRPGCVQPV